MGGELRFGEIVSFAFKTGIKNLPSLLGCVVLWVLTIWIPYVNVGTTIAILTLPACLSRGEVISPLRIFDRSYRKYMGEFFLAMGLKNLMVSPGFLFMILPGVVLSIAYSLTTLLIVDKGRSAPEALKLSLDATDGHKMAMFLWYLFFGIVVVLIPWWIFDAIWSPLAFLWLLVSSVAGIAAKGYIYGQLTAEIQASSRDDGQAEPRGFAVIAE